MIRPSFVPPPPIRRLRDLTRYRVDLVSARTAEKNRAEKLLEDAQIKLSVVASDIFGVSGRDMMAALIAGERDPKVLAQMARMRLRAKIGQLEEAFHGHFTDHHAFLLAKMLARVDAITADIDDIDAHIEDQLAPFVDAATRLQQIPGVGPVAAAVIVAEIGVDMSRFPTAGHLASWARFAPGVKESAGRNKGNGSTGHGNPYLGRVLGEAVVSAGRTSTFLGDRYRRLARRRGKQKAIVAVGRSMLIVAWHLLSDPDAQFTDLGPGFYDSRIQPDRKRREHIRQLEALGYRVTLEPAARHKPRSHHPMPPSPGHPRCPLTVDFRIRWSPPEVRGGMTGCRPEVRRGPFVAGLPSRSWCAQCSVVRRVADTSRTTITTGHRGGWFLNRCPRAQSRPVWPPSSGATTP